MKLGECFLWQLCPVGAKRQPLIVINSGVKSTTRGRNLVYLLSMLLWICLYPTSAHCQSSEKGRTTMDIQLDGNLLRAFIVAYKKFERLPSDAIPENYSIPNREALAKVKDGLKHCTVRIQENQHTQSIQVKFQFTFSELHIRTTQPSVSAVIYTVDTKSCKIVDQQYVVLDTAGPPPSGSR